MIRFLEIITHKLVRSYSGKILKKKKKDWTTLAEALLEYETLSGDEITVLLSDGIKPKRTDGKFGTKPAVPAVPSTKKGSIGSPQPES